MKAGLTVVLLAVGALTTAWRSAAGQSTTAAALADALCSGLVEGLHPDPADSQTRFMTGMLAHHAQGLAMMELAVGKASNPDLRLLAMRILRNYEDECTTIQLWLHDHIQSTQPTVEISTSTADQFDPFNAPPALPTPQSMEDLERATGVEFDRRFLSEAVRHHAAAVFLVESLTASWEGAWDETILQVASSVQGEHAAYVARMSQMLRDASESIR
jgi:uncharacterized protein (DUF305 family)